MHSCEGMIMERVGSINSWFSQVLARKNIVDKLVEISEEDEIIKLLSMYKEQQIEEIKICADLLSKHDKKYATVAEEVYEYQIKSGQIPNFRKK